MNLSLESTMGSQNKVLSRKVPSADLCLEVILLAAVGIMECWKTKAGSRETYHEVSAIAQPRVNRAWTEMMVVRMAGQFHSHKALTGDSLVKARARYSMSFRFFPLGDLIPAKPGSRCS